MDNTILGGNNFYALGPLLDDVHNSVIQQKENVERKEEFEKKVTRIAEVVIPLVGGPALTFLAGFIIYKCVVGAENKEDKNASGEVKQDLVEKNASAKQDLVKIKPLNRVNDTVIEPNVQLEEESEAVEPEPELAVAAKKVDKVKKPGKEVKSDPKAKAESKDEESELRQTQQKNLDEELEDEESQLSPGLQENAELEDKNEEPESIQEEDIESPAEITKDDEEVAASTEEDVADKVVSRPMST